MHFKPQTPICGGCEKPIEQFDIASPYRDVFDNEVDRRPMAINTGIRRIFSVACHGDGADVRRQARVDLLAAMDKAGWDDIGSFMRYHGLDVHAYFASKPI